MRIAYIFLTLLLAATGLAAQAQDYKNAVKVKGFAPMGVSYKHLTGFENGYELVYQTFDNGQSVTGLRVFQKPAMPKNTDRLFFCYGYGAHNSFYRSYQRRNPFRLFEEVPKRKHSYVAVGFDGYLGLEYRMLRNPLVFSIDMIPYFEYFGPNYFKVDVGRITAGAAFVF